MFLLSIAVLAASAWTVPLPLFVLAPTPAVPVYQAPDEHAGRPAIAVEGAVDDISGRLLLTTVGVGQATAVEAFLAMLDPYQDVTPRQAVIPPGIDEQEFFETQRQLFEESVRVAAAVGLRAAGIEVTVDGEGAEVVGVVPGGPADGPLQPGDVVVAVGDMPVRLAAELATRTAQTGTGEDLQLTVLRDGEEVTVTVTVGHLPGLDQQGIGVLVRTVNQNIDFPAGIAVQDRSAIGGPSAGVMLALTVFELFDQTDLTRGRIIAGTGTVTIDGRVGPIGGIAEKVRGAVLSDAEIFIAPAAQADEARRAAPAGLTVIAVADLASAIQALQR